MMSEKDRELKTCCGTPVKDPAISVVHEGRRFYFCEAECVEEFKEDPKNFLNSDHFLIDLEMVPREE